MSRSNSSFDLRPRPPDTTRLAEASSGRSDLVRFSDSHSVVVVVDLESTPSSTLPEPDSRSVTWKAVPRTVMALVESDDSTVTMAFPAYVGLVKASMVVRLG